MQTTNRIRKQLSEIIFMYWLCFSCTLLNNSVALKAITIKNIKYIYNEFTPSKTLIRLLWVLLYIFVHYSRSHRLRFTRIYFVDKKVLVYILFPNQAQEKNVCARISELDILWESVDRARNKCPLSALIGVRIKRVN